MDESVKKLIPEPDWEYLERKQYDYDIIPSNGVIYLILKNFEFPANYSPQKSDLLIILPPGYPNAALDMFRTNPDVKLANNAWPHTAQPHEMHINKSWQTWSRHFSWRVGVDNLRSFITAVKKELSKGI